MEVNDSLIKAIAEVRQTAAKHRAELTQDQISQLVDVLKFKHTEVQSMPFPFCLASAILETAIYELERE